MHSLFCPLPERVEELCVEGARGALGGAPHHGHLGHRLGELRQLNLRGGGWCAGGDAKGQYSKTEAC